MTEKKQEQKPVQTESPEQKPPKITGEINLTINLLLCKQGKE